MAKRRSKAQRAAREAARRHPKAFLALVIILVIIIAVCACLYFFVFKEEVDDFIHRHFGASDGWNATQAGSGEVSEIASADLSIHFIAPAVKASGDCSLIKVGNTEVLIDAGPTQGNTGTVKEYLARYCTDGVLEYVIATHADSDHIAGLVGESSNGTYNGIYYSYEIGTIIRFDKSNKSLQTASGEKTLYARYLEAETYAKERGTAVYTASQCWNGTDGAQRTYYLDEARTVSMNILYNYFYENTAPDENNYSVCMLLSQALGEVQNHYLFTGDLEKEGEEYLVENNTLPHVVLFKAGHHGSKTSSNNVLLEKISPEYVVVCCCAGYNEYNSAEENVFPTQAFCDRISAYTDKVYVTIVYDEENGFAPMNGDIVFYYGKREDEESATLKLWCSNNTTLLKDSDWFKRNRTWGGA